MNNETERTFAQHSTGSIKKMVWTEEVFQLLEKAKTVRGRYRATHMAESNTWPLGSNGERRSQTHFVCGAIWCVEGDVNTGRGSKRKLQRKWTENIKRDRYERKR